MASLSNLAIDQCLAELRAACRRPVDPDALDTLIDHLRPCFERVLDDPDGPSRWADHGQRMRENGRHLGALADFFGHRADAPIVGVDELLQAFTMVSAACLVGADENTC